MKLLTVAVPAYNMEKLLPRCLDSFISPAAEEWLEVIIINDGSSDNTSAVAADYCRRYPDIFSLVDKENGGHGSGINAGLARASGQYFKVVDSDDWVDGLSFLRLRDILAENDASLVATGFCCVDASSADSGEQGIITEQRSPIVGKPLAEGLYRFDDVCSELLVRMHSVTWKTDLLRRNNIVIDEHRFYVDMEYILFPVPYIETVYVCELPLYMYRLGANGQSVSIKSLQKNMQNHLDVMHRLLDYTEQQRATGLCAEKLDYLERGVAEMVTEQCLIYLSFPRSAGMKARFVELDQMLKKEHPGVYSAVKNKAVLALRMSSYALFGIASLAVRATRK